MYDELIKNLRHDSASALQNCDFDFVYDWMLEAADAIEELQKQLREEKVDNVNLTGWLAEEHAKHLWIPVTERLPEEYGHYLANIEGGEFAQISWAEIVYFDGKIFRWEHISTEYPEEVIHWMPLPQPPEREGNNVL